MGIRTRPVAGERAQADRVDPLGESYNRAQHLDERFRMMQIWADYLDGLKEVKRRSFRFERQGEQTMPNDEYDDISPEESEYNLSKKIEELETQPKYMRASLNDYLENPTDNGAKILWIKYTKLRKAVPRVIMDRMIDVIEHEVLGFSSKLYSSTNVIIEQVYDLMYLVISSDNEKLERFWNHLHNPERLGLLATICFDEKLLASARKAFPRREKLSNTKLYTFAVEYLQIEDNSDGKNLVENMRKSYERFVKANKDG